MDAEGWRQWSVLAFGMSVLSLVALAVFEVVIWRFVGTFSWGAFAGDLGAAAIWLAAGFWCRSRATKASVHAAS